MFLLRSGLRFSFRALEVPEPRVRKRSFQSVDGHLVWFLDNVFSKIFAGNLGGPLKGLVTMKRTRIKQGSTLELVSKDDRYKQQLLPRARWVSFTRRQMQ